MFPANGLYLVTPKGVVLLDTPWDSAQFRPLLDSIWLRHKQTVVLAIATHYHNDRTAGLAFLRQQGIKTYTSKTTWDLCAKFGEPQSEFYFTRDTVFRIGGLEIETYFPGGGHTRDNIVIWLKEDKILFGGCLVKSRESNSLGNTADAHLQQWENSIRNVMGRYPGPNIVIPGHGGWGNRRTLKHTLNLLKKGG
jgi:metallo-beta-lactamase class B